MPVRPWWERWPGRLEAELVALSDAGIVCKRDEEAYGAGILVLHLEFPADAGKIALTATFPDLYPYFRFEVVAPELQLAHHQNPLSGGLCLLGREGGNWDPTCTLARI